MKRVFVTGFGVVSAIGNNKIENLQSLCNGKTGIGTAQYLESKYIETHPFAEVKLSDAELANKLTISTPHSFTRTELLAFLAIDEAIEHSSVSKEEIISNQTALISASSVGGMCNMQELYEDSNLIGDASVYIDSYSPGLHTKELVKRYGIKGIIATVDTACSSSANAIALGVRLIKSGKINRAIVGGVDSLSKFTINGFDSLQILSTKMCRPFDEDREGLNLGEGAAFLVLESGDVAGNKPKYAEIAGYGNANDAHHPSAMSEDAIGVTESISKALKIAQISSLNVDFINTHGTATQNNDEAELKGIEKVFGTLPKFNSTKVYTGHTLAAAGAIEAVFSIFSINNKEIYKGLNCEKPIHPYNQFPVMEHLTDQKIDVVLSNSFGFAGNCSSLILKSVE